MEPNPALTHRYGTIDREYADRLAAAADDDGPVYMVNLMRYRALAEYADGRETTLTGQQADDTYAPFGPLAAVGAEIVFIGLVESQLLGAAPPWERVGVVRYPTRRAFMEMQRMPEFVELHAHKDAGMEATIVMGGTPMPIPPVPADLTPWTDVPHPPSAEDGPVVVLHVLSFHDSDSVSDMTQYTDHAALVAVPHGVRLDAWFAVEGTIIGDGRRWDQARFNAFPSKAAFMDVVFDPARLEAQKAHREVALADTYTMILRPIIDRLNEFLGPEFSHPLR